jgi:hypothetical protein
MGVAETTPMAGRVTAAALAADRDGGNRLNRKMWPNAATPSFQPIFFPSS